MWAKARLVLLAFVLCLVGTALLHFMYEITSDFTVSKVCAPSGRTLTEVMSDDTYYFDEIGVRVSFLFAYVVCVIVLWVETAVRVLATFSLMRA